MGSWSFSALNRGLQNLGTPCKGTFFVLFACTKRTKSTPEVCEPLDSGDDSKLCRKRFCKAFRRHVSKPVLPAKRRRKGFESVRKGYRRADARLLFFEKELLYCKLTVASDIRKGLLHVSFGAVRSCNCGRLNRGWQNLGASCEGVRVVTFCVVQKVTKKHAGRSPATHDSKLCRK